MSDHCRWCITPQGSLAGSIKRVERFRSGILHLGFGPVDVSGGIDWSTDPFDTRMWKFRLHNLQWLYDLYRVAAETDDAAAGVEANAVIEDWISHNRDPSTAADMAWENHVTALRARVIVCSVMAFGGPFHEILLDHAKVIAPVAIAEPAWNHGTDQLLTLLTIGCAVGDDGLTRKALDRLSETLPEIIDEQGVSNEQAPTYDYYVWSQLDEMARLMATCGLEELPVLERRLQTPVFLAHATRPDGRWAHIGDTTPNRVYPIAGTPLEYALSDGKEGSPPEASVAIYHRGYVFGRSGWGRERDLSQESWYSIRFGSGRQLHGHRDHTSFEWYAKGRPMIVEAGFGGYDENEFRKYDRSEFAHNQVVAADTGDYDANALTTLANHGWGSGWESYLLRDRPYRTIERRRAMFFAHNEPFMMIRDDLESIPGNDVAFTSLLHLPADVSETRPADGGYIFGVPSEDDLQLHVVIHGADGIEVFQEWQGTGGWVADGLLKRSPAPVLAARVNASRASITTVLVPVSQETAQVEIGHETIRLAIGDFVAEVRHDLPSGLLRPLDDEGSAWLPTLTGSQPPVTKPRRWARWLTGRKASEPGDG